MPISRNTTMIAGAALVALGGAAAWALPARAGQVKTAPAPVITAGEARSIALDAVPGDVLGDAESRNDGRVYAFRIRLGADIREVEVDAMTGRLVRTAEMAISG